jgi:hypothetical protein
MADMTTVLSDEERDANWRSPGAQIGHNNREAVRQFFADHLGCTNVDLFTRSNARLRWKELVA